MLGWAYQEIYVYEILMLHACSQYFPTCKHFYFEMVPVRETKKGARAEMKFLLEAPSYACLYIAYVKFINLSLQ